MKCLFYQHPYAFKTGSNAFFKVALSELGYEVISLSREDYLLGQQSGFDLVVLFQADELIANFPNSPIPVLVIPMLDEALNKPSSFYRGSTTHIYFSFAKDLHKFLILSGLRSTYIQYWPKVPDLSSNKRNEVFFWERTPIHVSTHDVKKWFERSNFEISVRNHRDPGHGNYDDLEFDEQNHKSEWVSPEEFQKRLAISKIFIAPRRWEGIGMTAIESMSQGNAVVGLSSPALKDYVIPGFSGVLIKIRNKGKALGEYDWDQMGINARLQAVEGRRNYENEFKSKLTSEISRWNRREKFRCLAILPQKLTLREFIFLKDFQR